MSEPTAERHAWLSASFGWPDALDDPGGEALPRFADAETSVRTAYGGVGASGSHVTEQRHGSAEGGGVGGGVHGGGELARGDRLIGITI